MARGTVVVFRYGTGSKGKGLEKGRRALKQPRGLHVCADGSLLVADYGNHCVLRFKPADTRGKVIAGEEGKSLPQLDLLKDIDRPLGAPEGEGFLMKLPCDVCVGPEGAVLVLDNEEARVQSFDGKGGQATQVAPPPGGSWIKSNQAPEAIKNPRSFAVAPDGAIVMCDTWAHRVLRYAAPGSPEANEKPAVLAGTPNSTGQRPDQLAFPSCVAFGPDGALYISDTNNHRVQRFEKDSAEGTTVAGSAKCESGPGLGELSMPTGICFDPSDGSLLVADRGNSRILRFPAGSRAGDHGDEVVGASVVQRPWGIAIDAQGAIYVSDDRQATVLKLGNEAMAAETAAAAAAVTTVEDDEPEAPPAPAAAAPAQERLLVEEVPASRAAPAPAVSGSHMDLD